MQVQKRKRKSDQNNAQIRGKKVKFAYTKKNGFSLEVNKAKAF